MPRASLQASVPNSGAHTELSERRDFWALTFGSIGVVYGDIGTSPLYALRESVLATGPHFDAGKIAPPIGHPTAVAFRIVHNWTFHIA
jgi:K+ potassium transporter integral membrane domain